MSVPPNTRAELFGIAMDILLDKPIKERKALATRAAALAVEALTSDGAARELNRLIGGRGSAALLAKAAKPVGITAAAHTWVVGTRPKIAISTAQETLVQAAELREALRRLKAEVWLFDSIPIGRRPIDEAERAMTTNDYVVLLASPQAADSEWVKFELDLVTQAELQDRRDRLLPVLVGIRTKELRPYLRLPHNVKWDVLGAEGVAGAIRRRIEDDRKRSRDRD